MEPTAVDRLRDNLIELAESYDELLRIKDERIEALQGVIEKQGKIIDFLSK